jgi:hypothetical protein
MRYAFFAFLLSVCTSITTASDWLTLPSTYSHDAVNGQRVSQHTPIELPATTTVPNFRTSGYTHTRSRLGYNGSADNYHRVEEWGEPVRPYGEWQRPFRPFSVPYSQWGPPFAGLNQQFGRGNGQFGRGNRNRGGGNGRWRGNNGRPGGGRPGGGHPGGGFPGGGGQPGGGLPGGGNHGGFQGHFQNNMQGTNSDPLPMGM